MKEKENKENESKEKEKKNAKERENENEIVKEKDLNAKECWKNKEDEILQSY